MDIQAARDLPQVVGDSLQLEQVMMNLLRNSVESIVEAGRYDGRIMVTVQPEPSGLVTTCVRDNGPGFDPALMEQALAPFTTTKPDGMGLGLSLCRSIIEAHRGRLSVGGDTTGAVVCFSLPAAVK
jgi:signal transduction histidine kinase